MALPIIKTGSKTVGAADSTFTITFATDEDAGTPAAFPAGYSKLRIVATPDWDAGLNKDSISLTEAVFTCTPPGGYGGTVDWIAIGRT